MLLPFAHVLLSMAFALGHPSPRAEKTQIPGGPHDFIISGTVRRDDTDEPVPGVRIELLAGAGNVAHSAVLTNDSGEFSFGQFAPGQYEIVAERDGYQPVRLHVEVSRYDQPNLIVRMRKQLVAPNPSGDVTTAHQLAIPQKARAAFEKGIAKADSRGDFKDAVQDFQRAINIYPEYYEAYAEMGTAYLRLKDFAAAEKALRQSIEMSAQKYVPPLMLLSMLLNDQNRSGQAEPLARQVIAVDPTAWRGPYELSRALLALRRLPEAEASAYAARDLKPENPDIYLLLSEIHRHTQNPSALLQDIDAYLKLAPQGPAAPQVRKLREQLLKFMKAQSKATGVPQ
jgi:cytochrome c-type biogenesis protein CcmH/NrfG